MGHAIEGRATVTLDQVYRERYGRLLAGLIRVVRDVQLAEDANLAIDPGECPG